MCADEISHSPQVSGTREIVRSIVKEEVFPAKLNTAVRIMNQLVKMKLVERPPPLSAKTCVGLADRSENPISWT